MAVIDYYKCVLCNEIVKKVFSMRLIKLKKIVFLMKFVVENDKEQKMHKWLHKKLINVLEIL